jgi:hypothetical protein
MESCAGMDACATALFVAAPIEIDARKRPSIRELFLFMYSAS